MFYFLNPFSLERSKALLEKTKYALANNELKKNEELLQSQKEAKAFERQRTEDLKVVTIKKKLQKTKE